MPTPPRFWDRLAPPAAGSEFDLAAESIAVKIRWFGLGVGALLANFASYSDARPLNAILLLGFGFTLFDSILFFRGRVFLRDFPLLISAMEALFIGMLCHFENGPDSAFRFYYLLSLICCAIRYSAPTTFLTCGLDCLSYGLLYAFSPKSERDTSVFFLTVVILIWATWAAVALARLRQKTGIRLEALNAELTANKAQLEDRIAERSRELEESQAQVLHQEKMAAFGLLAAGIAHEVGNPLAAISNVVQLLQRRELDEYAREKLQLVTGQLSRIQGTLRELVAFSRPASDERTEVPIREFVEEALGIAKYYKGGQNRRIETDIPAELPPLVGVRDQFVQVVFNLIVNAIDATGRGGTIRIAASCDASGVALTVSDDGIGIEAGRLKELFRPYFTTKKHGTGLGLFVLRRIVESQGGTASVESTPGSGTVFTVRWKTTPGLPGV